MKQPIDILRFQGWPVNPFDWYLKSFIALNDHNWSGVNRRRIVVDWRRPMFHSSRAILALNGTLMMILGGSFWFFPEFFTLSMFPDIADNQDAIDVGVALRKNMGVGSAFIGLILFSCQTSSKSMAQRLLFTSAVGFLLWIAALLHMRLSGGVNIPMFIIGFFAFLCILSLFVATRRFQE